MAKQDDHEVYTSFLVRCWFIPPVVDDETPTWRFELREMSAEAQKHRFRNFEQLVAFMSGKLTAVAVNNNQDDDHSVAASVG
ncbi:MAG: hypothetical protein KBE23_05305 [Chloroflexi bacterium]|nr:hypothetical protein [Chloroflexota bacterium]MBP7042137.1 hypothetical protein [Chloroflexota bacterium]